MVQDYDLDIYFIEYWNDSRLRHSHDEPLSINDDGLIKQIWLPDIYFANSKTAKYNYITVPNFLVLVHPNGTVRFAARLVPIF